MRSSVGGSSSVVDGPLVLSRSLRDFSYVIGQTGGVIYFLTDYSLIERLIVQMGELRSLRLYILGCSQTNIDGQRLEKNLFSSLPHLRQFTFFFQSYGGGSGRELTSMSHFSIFPWNFGCSSNPLTEMHYLFTIPYSFPFLHQCVNESFFASIRTSNPFSKFSSLSLSLSLR